VANSKTESIRFDDSLTLRKWLTVVKKPTDNDEGFVRGDYDIHISLWGCTGHQDFAFRQQGRRFAQDSIPEAHHVGKTDADKLLFRVGWNNSLLILSYVGELCILHYT
jgi:hypothetical protein